MAPPLNPDAKRMKMTTRAGSSGNTDDARPRDTCISDLPICILGTILTLLTVRDATRMTAVSKEWKPVYNSPDCRADSIDDTDLWHGQRRPRTRNEWSEQRGWRANVITSMLAGYGGPIRRFIIQRTPPLSPTGRWLRMLSEKGVVQELVLHMPSPTLHLSYFIFNCSSLRSLSLDCCTWPNVPDIAFTGYSPAWTLPHLVELTLSRMDMTMSELEDLLRRCTALLSLALCYPRQGGRVRILCETLQSVTFVGRDANPCWVLVSLWKTPNLQQLLWWPPAPFSVRYGPPFSVRYGPPFSLRNVPFEQRMPRLHTLGVFHRYAISVVGVTIRNARTIALRTDLDSYSEVQQAMVMLHSLPHLETLHLQLDNGSKNRNVTAASYQEITDGPVPCLERSLKTIVLRAPNLIHKKLAFANFLLGAAKVLKLMLICNKRMSGELLRPESRGSPNAQVVFLGNSKCTLELNSMSASNYKLADPFMP